MLHNFHCTPRTSRVNQAFCLKKIHQITYIIHGNVKFELVELTCFSVLDGVLYKLHGCISVDTASFYDDFSLQLRDRVFLNVFGASCISLIREPCTERAKPCVFC